MKITRRGFALISTLLFLGILFMMSVSIIMMSRQRVFSGLVQHHKSQALYLAEAGLAKSEVALEADLSWPGEPNGTVDGIPGTYEVHLGTDRNGSVINIGTDTPADSYRGKDTVPKNTALLIVTANVSGQTYTLEALVQGKGSVGYMSDAILASGKIRAKGDLDVDGIAALDDSKRVNGNMQANSPESSSTVVWSGGGTAHVTGNVGTGGPPTGINMGAATIDGKLESNSPANVPHTDIAGEVAKNKSHPAPAFSATGTSVVGSGKYSTGSVNLNGDLVLKDDSTLYVDGDLEINGSITGKGSIYVTGKTTFKGDARVTTNKNFSIALFSKGDVSLKGFDGTAYLQAQGGSIASDLQIVKSAVGQLQNLVNTNSSGASTAATQGNLLEILGYHHWVGAATVAKFNSGTGANVTVGQTVNGGSYHADTFGTMMRTLKTTTSGPTSDFVVKRLEYLRELATSADDLPAYRTLSVPENGVMASFNSDPAGTAGTLDTLTGSSGSNWGSFGNLVNAIDYDKIGSSYFLGAIYTQGRFVAENEVTVVGALMADAPAGGPEQSIALSDGSVIKMKPGDVYLGTRTHVTYVEDMFKDKNIDYTGPQLLAKDIWMGR